MERQVAPPHRVLAKAIIRDCVITLDGVPLKVNNLSCFVNLSMPIWQRRQKDERLVGKLVDVRIRHLRFEEGTPNARDMWDATVVGDIK